MADPSVVRIRASRAGLVDAPGFVRVHLLGTMRMIAPGGDDILPRLRKTRAVLACLCLAEGVRVSRARLVGLLWDRSAETQGRQSLRHALAEINATINGRHPALVEIGRECIRLNADACWIDAVAAPAEDCTGRLLDDLDGISAAFDQWLAAERSRFEDRQRQALERELEQLVKDGAAPPLRAAAARRLVTFDPTHELAVRSLMTACVELGDRPQAIREYERCRQALRMQLDLAPSRETTALYEMTRVAAVGRPAAVAVVVAAGRSDRAAAEAAPAPRLASTAASAAPAPRLASTAASAAPAPRLASTAEAAASARQPLIAVLPFHNLSSAAPYEPVAAGLREDLIEALSRVPNLSVISRLASLAVADGQHSPREIGRALGVNYLLSGTLRAVGDRLRLNAELTDAASGAALWSSALDERFTDLLEMQPRVANEVVRRVAPHMHAAELRRARTKRPEDLAAYDLLLRAQEAMHSSSRLIFDEAERLFDAALDPALDRDPDYTAALSWRAYWHALRVGQGWSADPDGDIEQAEDFAYRAIDRDPLEPMALAVRGYVASYLRSDFDFAFDCFERALRINPNAAPAWLWSAGAHAYKGHGTRAIEEIGRAIALSPYDPLMYAYSTIAGVAYLADHQCERAIEFASRSMRENRAYTSAYKVLIMALGMAGREAEAQPTVRQLLKLEPGFTVDGFSRRSPTMASPLGAAYCDALARAGVPLSG
jgi:TolB-like protein/DNA-binding SARP family transcriptional activator